LAIISSQKSHTCAQNFLFQHERKRQILTLLANSRLNNLHFTR